MGSSFCTKLSLTQAWKNPSFCRAKQFAFVFLNSQRLYKVKAYDHILQPKMVQTFYFKK